MFGSWQAKNWDPKVGSEEFDEFCKRINHPFNSLEDAVVATGVDLDDAMTLASTPGFDFALLNYAAYVRTVGRLEGGCFLRSQLRQKILPECPKDQTVEQVSFVPPPPSPPADRKLPVLRDVRRREIPGNFSGSGLETLAVPGLYPVGLLLCESAPLNGFRI